MIIACDPGTTESAIVRWDGHRIVEARIMPNPLLLIGMRRLMFCNTKDSHLHIEMFASFGMIVGKEVFETCVWIGRFSEAWSNVTGVDAHMVYRQQVKMHLCQTPRAKDSNIRQALIDRFGPPGTKKDKGVTYGLKSHLWSAFAIAVYAHDNAVKPGAPTS